MRSLSSMGKQEKLLAFIIWFLYRIHLSFRCQLAMTMWAFLFNTIRFLANRCQSAMTVSMLKGRPVELGKGRVWKLQNLIYTTITGVVRFVILSSGMVGRWRQVKGKIEKDGTLEERGSLLRTLVIQNFLVCITLILRVHASSSMKRN